MKVGGDANFGGGERGIATMLVPILAISLGMVALSMALASAYAAPVGKVQAQLAEAATALRRGQVFQAIDELDAAGSLAPADPRILRWRIQLRQEWAVEAMRFRQPEQAHRAIDSALAVLDESHRVVGPMPHRLRSNVHALAGDLFDDDRSLALAAEARAEALTLSPYDLSDQVMLADLYQRLGRPAAARQAYRQALELSDFKYLDPAAQLTAEQRARIENVLRDTPSP